MRRPFESCLPLLALALAFGPAGADEPGAVPGSAQEVEPIEVGATIPAVTLRDPDGNSVPLKTLVAEQPTVLIFYRGGW
jgi:cytochrome oxidase Cu insertion factor (SCO1/SenC/PrrC family)